MRNPGGSGFGGGFGASPQGSPKDLHDDNQFSLDKHNIHKAINHRKMLDDNYDFTSKNNPRFAEDFLTEGRRLKLLRGEPPSREDFEMWKNEILILKHGNLANAQEAARYGGSSVLLIPLLLLIVLFGRVSATLM
jgi:hypothetical protein